MMENVAREAEMDKVEAKMIIEGDPIMQAEIVVRIKNIQTIHAGDYYLKKVEHSIGSSGYRTKMESLKIMAKAAFNGISVKARTETDVINQYAREQAMFYNWGIDVMVGSEPKMSTHAGTHTSVNQWEEEIYMPLSTYLEYYQELPLDQLVTTLLKKAAPVPQYAGTRKYANIEEN
jgi:hypothetical protein